MIHGWLFFFSSQWNKIPMNKFYISIWQWNGITSTEINLGWLDEEKKLFWFDVNVENKEWKKFRRIFMFFSFLEKAFNTIEYIDIIAELYTNVMLLHIYIWLKWIKKKRPKKYMFWT